MGCHALLQGISLTQEPSPHLLRLLHSQAGSPPIVPPGMCTTRQGGQLVRAEPPRSSSSDLHKPAGTNALLRARDREGGGGGAGGREMPRQTWINEITVTAAAGSLGEEEPPEHLPSHRGNSNMADMVTWRVYAGGLELPAADARARSRANGLRVGQGLPRTPAGKTKNAETRCLEPQMRCP